MTYEEGVRLVYWLYGFLMGFDLFYLLLGGAI